MSRMPGNNWNNRFSGFPPQRFRPPPRRRRRIIWRFRRIWLIPLVIVLAYIVIRRILSRLTFGLCPDIDWSLDWDGFLDFLSIRNHEAFTHLFLWGLALIGLVIVCRIIIGKRKKEDS